MIARKNFMYLAFLSTLFLFFSINVQAQLSFSLPDGAGTVGNSISIPISASEITEENGLYAVTFNVVYDSDIIFISGIETDGTMLDDAIVSTNPNYADGKIRISGVSVNPILGSGTLLNLEVDLLAVGESDLTWDGTLFEGENAKVITPDLLNGSVTVSEVPQLNAPNLSSPSDGATGVSTPARLRWQSVAEASSYNLQLSKDNSFTQLVLDKSNLLGTNYNATGLDYETQYYWRVSSQNDNSTSEWSEVWSFTTGSEPNPLSAPSLISPSNGAENETIPVKLNWDFVSGATDYDVQLASSDTFSDLIVDEKDLSVTSFTVTELDYGTTYHWRVRAKNLAETSEWSGSWSFTTVIDSGSMVPEKVILKSPEDGATIEMQEGETSVNLGWASTVNPADSYELEVATDEAFSQIVYSSSVTDTFAVFADAELQKTYYWKVKGTNEYGSGVFSDIWSFNLIISGVEDDQLGKNFSLQQNFPNPFNPTTTINYNVPELSNVKLEIFDALGRYITTLVNEQQAGGNYEFKWIPENLSSGVYLYRFTAISEVSANQFVEVKSMVLMK